MNVSFDRMAVGNSYDRQELANLWGYVGIEALQRGVVTPRDDNKVILFVTENKHPDATQYQDRLADDTLEWEGPNDHFAEDRMINAAANRDEIHLFHRMNPTERFVYHGQLDVIDCQRQTDRPSRFKFRKRSR